MNLAQTREELIPRKGAPHSIMFHSFQHFLSVKHFDRQSTFFLALLDMFSELTHGAQYASNKAEFVDTRDVTIIGGSGPF